MSGGWYRSALSERNKPRVLGVATFLVGVIGAGLCFLIGVLRLGLSNSNFFNYRTETTSLNLANSIPAMWCLAGVVLVSALLLFVIVTREFAQHRPWRGGLMMLVWAGAATCFNSWVLFGS